LNCWKMKPRVLRRSAARSPSLMLSTGRPSKSTSPEVGRSRAPKSWSIVVLPEPLGPARATNSPRWIVRSMLSTAVTCVAPSL
jgi:hypothetical protein